MNPIEKACSKLKAYPREIAGRAVAGLMRIRRMRQLLDGAAMIQLDRSLL
jgi:hypothetical protein